MRTVTASEANRHFSSLLRDVAAGETVVVTSHGRAVAKLVPTNEKDTSDHERRDQVWQEIPDRVRGQPVLDLPRESREDIYDRDR
jgi:prevent-host-death family protein